MSAINDALKKTQSALSKQPVPETSAFTSMDPPVETSTNPSRFSLFIEKIQSAAFHEDAKEITIDFLTNKFFIGTIGSLLLIGISIPAFHHIHQFLQYKNIISQKIQKSETLPALPAPATTTEKSVNLILNGTVRAGSNRDAMINNHLYRVGDMVNRYKILEIRYAQVTLLDTETKKTTILITELS